MLTEVIDLETMDTYHIVECAINSEPFYIQVRPDWAPLGAARFEELVSDGYFNHSALFRALKDFIVQFGISGDVEKARKWSGNPIKDDITDEKKDDLPKIPFEKGILSFAGSGPDSRETQMFFTLVETDWLGQQSWEQPFAEVIYNVDILDTIFFDYEEQPEQGMIWNEGYEYLRREFPELSYLDYCRHVQREDVIEMVAEQEGDSESKKKGYFQGVLNEIDKEKKQMKEIEGKIVDRFGYPFKFLEILLIFIVLAILYCVVYRLQDTRNSKAE